MRDFEHSLPMALLRARESVMQIFRPTLRAHSLTDQQWRVLRALAEEDTLGATAIARRTLILSPSLSRILRDLLQRGLVRRHSVRGRSARATPHRMPLTLTVAGRRLFDLVARDSEQSYRRIAAAYDPERLAALYRQLDELRHVLVTASRQTGTAPEVRLVPSSYREREEPK